MNGQNGCSQLLGWLMGWLTSTLQALVLINIHDSRLR